MLQIYGSPISAPCNKVRYVANYLNIPYNFIRVNLSAGEQRKAEFLNINPLGKIPAINDDGFTLGESNAIIRYLADKQSSTLYPRELQQRAIVDEWLDYATQHVGMAISKIMFNTYFYKISNAQQDVRSLEEGYQFIQKYLPHVEQQLTKNQYLTDKHITLADIAMLTALDASELAKVDLTNYPHISAWRAGLMQEKFYLACHETYASAFHAITSKILS